MEKGERGLEPTSMPRAGFLVFRVAGRLCALPLTHVIEIMRPPKIDPMSGAAAPLLGVSLIRGKPTPVIDAAALLGSTDPHPARFVTVRVGPRSVALAVEAVIGLREVPAEAHSALPLLLEHAEAGAVDTIGAADGELMLVLAGARLVPEAVWDLLEHPGAVS